MDSGLVRGKSVDFRLPTPPPSMNALYQIHYAKRQVFMKPEVRAYKNTAKLYVPPFDTKKEDMLGIEMAVSQDWYFKNGAMKKQDVQNMAKVLIDIVAEKMGFDDSQVWEFRLVKVQEVTKTGVAVKIWKMVEEEKQEPLHRLQKAEAQGE